jgi:antitoxin (DNA-binding transcriptional repressor) of toxin-antitoxin stability system
MREIGAFEAKNTLGTLLDLVEQGEEVVITRRGKPVARLVRETAVPNRDKARRAAANILARGKGRSLGGLTIRELIDEGRR